MINTPFGHATRADGYELRLEAVKHGVTHVTNLAGAQAMVAGMEVARLGGLTAVSYTHLDVYKRQGPRAPHEARRPHLPSRPHQPRRRTGQQMCIRDSPIT